MGCAGVEGTLAGVAAALELEAAAGVALGYHPPSSVIIQKGTKGYTR